MRRRIARLDLRSGGDMHNRMHRQAVDGAIPLEQRVRGAGMVDARGEREDAGVVVHAEAVGFPAPDDGGLAWEVRAAQ